jgi:hypothetical protein
MATKKVSGGEGSHIMMKLMGLIWSVAVIASDGSNLCWSTALGL